MPTYEYACKECGEHLEVVQKFSDDALTTCPACRGPLRKVFSSIGISFKGSGFYKNDSRTAGAAKTKEPAGSDGGSSSADTSTTTGDAAAKGDKGSNDKATSDKGSNDKAKSDPPKGDKPKSDKGSSSTAAAS